MTDQTLAADFEGRTSPLEKFVLILKDDLDALHQDLQKMKNEINTLRESLPCPPPVNVHLEGSFIASRWFIRICTNSFISMRQFVDFLHANNDIVHIKSAYFVETDIHNNDSYKHSLVGFICCDRYVMLGNIAHLVDKWLDDRIQGKPFIYMLNLERTADTVCIMNEIIVAQIELRGTSTAITYEIKEGELCEVMKSPETVPPFLLQTRREYPLIF